MGLEIQRRNVEMTPRWKTEIEVRMEDLQRRQNDLTPGRVTLAKNRHHKKQEHVAETLVAVTLPSRHTLTARKEDKTFGGAIRNTFEAVTSEILKYRKKRAQAEMRLPPVPPHRGVICKLFPLKTEGSSSESVAAKSTSMRTHSRISASNSSKMEWTWYLD